MGIKGLYRELGTGKRVSLARLAAESLEEHDRPLRLAIDVAIWQFQNQAARGGTNPAVRTLFYRLVRLLGTPIQPVFVFDGPNKPRLKRNKRSGRADGVAVAQAKRLIQLFGFVAHDAPGEAEAECAYLQKHGVVDAVLSEDVDTIMFGCTRTLRNWSAEGSRSTIPTHVSLYDVDDDNDNETDNNNNNNNNNNAAATAGLGREGMVLVALMSGGDYLPEGVPGCGVKTACEAARAGFGAALCRLKAADAHGLERWRESLVAELRTNESGFFRTRHTKLAIPDDFPDMEILRYYTHPVVSTPAALDAVARRLAARQEIHLDALREFARETMDWAYRGGALKFIRTMSRGMLVHRLQQGGRGAEGLVQAITLRRAHADCDGQPEMRLAYVPGDVVPIDLSDEVEPDVSYGRGGLALNSDDEFDVPLLSGGVQPDDGVKVVFDPAKRELAWVLESVARKSLPDLVRAFELKQATKKRTKSPKGTSRARAKKPTPVSHGSMERFVRVAKPTSSSSSSSLAKPSSSATATAAAVAAATAAVSKSSASSSSSSKAKDAIAVAVEENYNLLQPSRATSKHRPLAAANPRDWSPSSSPIPRRPRAAAAEPGLGPAPGPGALDAGRARGRARSASPEAAQDALAGDGRVPASVRAILSQGGEPQGVAKERGRPKPTPTPTTTTTTTTTTTSTPTTIRATTQEKGKKASRALVQASMDSFTQVVAPSASRPDCEEQGDIGVEDENEKNLDGAGLTKKKANDDEIIIVISDDDDDDDDDNAPSCDHISSSAQAKNARHSASGSRSQGMSHEEKQVIQKKSLEERPTIQETFQEIQEIQEIQESQEKSREERQEKHQTTQDKPQEKQQKNQTKQKTRTKTLLVPSACGAGYREIHVSEGEREARIRREERRLARAGCRTHVVRLSDVDFVDLSGE